MKKIAIVGSGIGGSGIGALLSTEKKYDIVVLEKSNLIGGRCASYKRTDKQGREWIFDVGCHTFSTCDKGPLGEILRRCGKENAVKWIYTPITTNLMGVVTSPGAKKKTARTHGPQKEKPEKKINALQYMARLPYEETFKYDHISLKEFSENLTKTQGLKFNNLINSMTAYIFFGTSLSGTSAGEFLRCFSSNALNRSTGYPIGGTGAIPQAYCNIIKENGGNVIIGKEGTVKKIRVENNQVKGVEVGDKFIEADIVIANSDIKTTVFKLIGENNFSKEYLAYVNGLTWGGQGCTLKLALSKSVTADKSIMYIPKVDVKGKSLNDIEIKEMFYGSDKIPELVPMLIVPITNADPALAPTGGQTLHCVTVTRLDGVKEWTESEEKQWEKACMNTFLTLWPDLEKYIVLKEFMGPRWLTSTLGKSGSGTGTGQTIDQVGDKRPSMISPIKGLCYCSGDAGGWGVGTELPARAVLQLYDIFKKNNLDIDKIWS